MFFNSFIFLFAFLPITWLLVHFAGKTKKPYAAAVVLVAVSLFFYSFGNPIYLLLIAFSLFANYFLGYRLAGTKSFPKMTLALGILLNVGILAYFKYLVFFIANVDALLNVNWNATNVFLPLGISFFTFQQISYLIDCYKGKIHEYNFLNYLLFITFFPKLISGPIVRYQEIVTQFKNLTNHIDRYRNLVFGLSLFSLGLFKKVVIADGLSPWVSATFDTNITPTFIEAWCGALSYTFQIYFDFSGYTDMALGLGKIFNIDLPINFNSPYKATSIIDFWRRWHITLAMFFRDYLYIPLGGSQKGRIRQSLNIMLTMCLCGLWHGAAWTFVFWGTLHGIMSCVNHLWRHFSNKFNIASMPGWLGWLITFPCVVIAWIFFRADTLSRAWVICKGCFGMNGFVLPPTYLPIIPLQQIATKIGFAVTYTENWTVSGKAQIFALPILLLFCLFFQNSMKTTNSFLNKRPLHYAVACSFVMIFSLLSITDLSEFIYSQF